MRNAAIGKYKYVRPGGKTKGLHIVMAEKAIGKTLPKGARVHHVDYNKANNICTNLVICPSHEYHMLLHRRTDALNACGHADWRRCVRCGKYGNPEQMSSYQSKQKNTAAQYQHHECNAKHVKSLQR